VAADPVSWSKSPAGHAAPLGQAEQWTAITDSPLPALTSPRPLLPLPSSTESREDWQPGAFSPQPPAAWWQQQQHEGKANGGNRAAATSSESRGGNSHQFGGGLDGGGQRASGPSAPGGWPSPGPEANPGRADAAAGPVSGNHAEPPLANQLRQLAASALPFSQVRLEALR
jgi:hypothetical protein